MAQVDKIKAGDTTYDINKSPDSTNTFVSGDVSTDQANTYKEVSPLTSNDTNSTVLNKTSSMNNNTKYVKNSIGNVDNVSEQLNNKAPKEHTHSINDIPVDDQLVYSTTSVPSSKVVYDLNTKIQSATEAKYKVTTENLTEGNIRNGTTVKVLQGNNIVKSVTGNYDYKNQIYLFGGAENGYTHYGSIPIATFTSHVTGVHDVSYTFNKKCNLRVVAYNNYYGDTFVYLNDSPMQLDVYKNIKVGDVLKITRHGGGDNTFYSCCAIVE